MNRSECLHAATKCVCGQREQDYGKPEDNFGTIGILWSTYLRAAHPDLAAVMGVNRIDAKDVAVMMALLKIARIATGSTEDSFVDLAGYAACAAEIATGGPYPSYTAMSAERGIVASAREGDYKFVKTHKFKASSFIKAVKTARMKGKDYTDAVDRWLKANQKKYGYVYSFEKAT